MGSVRDPAMAPCSTPPPSKASATSRCGCRLHLARVQDHLPGLPIGGPISVITFYLATSSPLQVPQISRAFSRHESGPLRETSRSSQASAACQGHRCAGCLRSRRSGRATMPRPRRRGPDAVPARVGDGGDTAVDRCTFASPRSVEPRTVHVTSQTLHCCPWAPDRAEQCVSVSGRRFALVPVGGRLRGKNGR